MESDSENLNDVDGNDTDCSTLTSSLSDESYRYLNLLHNEDSGVCK